VWLLRPAAVSCTRGAHAHAHDTMRFRDAKCHVLSVRTANGKYGIRGVPAEDGVGMELEGNVAGGT
jgi:hypothetical protein